MAATATPDFSLIPGWVEDPVPSQTGRSRGEEIRALLRQNRAAAGTDRPTPPVHTSIMDRVPWYCVPTAVVFCLLLPAGAVVLLTKRWVPRAERVRQPVSAEPPLPRLVYCRDVVQVEGESEPVVEEVGGGGTPDAPCTLYARVRVPRGVLVPQNGSSLVSWGPSCAQLVIAGSGNVEFREGWQSLAAEPAENLADGVWHNLVVTRQADGLNQLYVDGFLVASGAFPTAGVRGRRLEFAATCWHRPTVAEGAELATIRTFAGPIAFEQLHAAGGFRCLTTTTTSTTSTTTSTTSMTNTSTTRTVTSSTTTSVEANATRANSTTTTTTSTHTSSTSTATTTTATTTTSSTDTATSTTSTTRTTTTTTWTVTTKALPRPFYSSSGGHSGPAIGEAINFEGAELPTAREEEGSGLTLVALVRSSAVGVDQDVASWEVFDGGRRCVELRVSSEGFLEYREGSEVVSTEDLQPPIDLADGRWHRVAVSRSAMGIAYLYVDDLLAAQALLRGPLPAGSRGTPLSGRSCDGRRDLVFDGDVAGLRMYDSSLTQGQLDRLGGASRTSRGPTMPPDSGPTALSTTAGPTAPPNASSVLLTVRLDNLNEPAAAASPGLAGRLAGEVERIARSTASKAQALQDAAMSCAVAPRAVACELVPPPGGDAIALQSALADPPSLAAACSQQLAESTALAPLFAGGVPRVGDVRIRSRCCLEMVSADCLACVIGVTMDQLCLHAHKQCEGRKGKANSTSA